MKSTLAVFLASLLSVFTLTACETTEGVGNDVENAAEEVEDAVD